MNPMLELLQLLAVVLMGIQLGVSYAHFMQMPGKLELPLDCYILVQNDVIRYRVKLGLIEVPAIISALAAALLLRKHRKVFWLTILGAACMVALWVVWAIFIQPINQQVDNWSPAFVPENWMELRYQWHFYHLIRLWIAAFGVVALTLSLMMEKTRPAS
jgi:hypothetical protein